MIIKHLTEEELVGRPWISITRKGIEYDLMPAVIVITLLVLSVLAWS